MRPIFDRPVAITMWDFSWLERRWSGAGYEDWGTALDELVERGYDAVRIDAFPHLVASDPGKVWKMLPLWNQHSWGAQSVVHIQVAPALTDFIAAAAERGVKVGLSSWFREDEDNVRVLFDTPELFAQMWASTIRLIDEAGLLDNILYVDLCNEFPYRVWAPWMYTKQLAQNVLRNGRDNSLPITEFAPGEATRLDPTIAAWMRDTIRLLRAQYPDLDYTYSFSSELATWREQDVDELDVMENHVWLANNEFTDYYRRVGYSFEKFSPTGYDNVVANGRTEYLERQEQYDTALFRMIDEMVEWSRTTGKALYITECWALVDYKDWPGLEWDWIKDINARAVAYAAKTGRFVGMATSNFCGPQFVGMWRDVAWHRRLTDLIKSAPIDADLRRVTA